jgi:DNA mismatch repair protein MutS2
MTSAEDQSIPPEVGFQRAIGLLEFDQIRLCLAETTRTTLGGVLAAELTPSPDPRDIAVRQQETAEARRLLDTTGALELGPEEDLRPAVQRALLGGVLRGEELRHVGALAAAARWNRGSLARRDDLPVLAAIAQNLPELPDLESAVNRAIGPSGEVLDDASPELGRLRRESRSAWSSLNDVMQRSLRRYQRSDVIQEDIITERNGRMVLLIKTEFKGQAPGIIHDVSDSGATVFIEPMPAIDLGNRWRETRLAEQREEERVLRQLSEMVGRYSDDIALMLSLLARLDLAAAKGRYGASLRAVPPTLLDVDEPRRLEITGGRHPLLTGDVVPTTISISASQPVLVVTGPNAGGKTVALKTAGLLSMMAQAGLQVPADDAVLPLLDGVYADIGDQQSIFESLSTFSSHIRNLQRIMDVATANSLILIDELGSATDPEEGAALAIALLSHLRDLGAMVVATTHHRNVARLAQEEPGMVNASVDLNPRTLEPTYRLTHGVPGRSYALTIASRLGLPETVISGAQSHLEPTHVQTDQLLQELQEERLTVSELRVQAEQALNAARVRELEIAQELEAVEDTKAQLVEDARRELAEQIVDLTGRIRRAERSLERASVAADGQARDVDLRAERESLVEAQREVVSPDWAPIPVERPPWYHDLRPGDRVYIRGVSRPVEVVTAPDRQQEVEVLIGSMKARLPVYQLDRPADRLHPVAEQAGVVYRRPESKRTLSPEVNLHGYRVDEALNVIDSLLDDAALEGMSSLKIVHGKGTGALRRAIREYLAGHPLVVAAEPGEGGSAAGVTVVQLR